MVTPRPTFAFNHNPITDVCSDFVILDPLPACLPSSPARPPLPSLPAVPARIAHFPARTDGATPIVTAEETHVALMRLGRQLPL